MSKYLRYWGYVNDKGYLTVMEYHDEKTILDFQKLSSVKKIFMPIHADDLADARRQIEMSLKEIN